MRRKIIGGFTLLEVMVTVAILSLSLVAILSSQGGAIRTGAFARQVSTGTFLARCKMAEVEERLMKEGFNLTAEHGEDECCEDGEQDGFVCSWSVEPVVLPETMGEDEDILADDYTSSTGGDSLNQDDLTNALSGAAGGDAVGSFALQYSWPILRPMIEEQVRRATVAVRWRNGLKEPSGRGPCEEGELDCISVVQYIVADQGMAFPGSRDAQQDSASQNPGQNPAQNQGQNPARP